MVSFPWCSACALACQNKQDEIEAETASFDGQIFRQHAAGHRVMAVVKVVGKPVLIARPFLHTGAMLEVVHISVRRLPLLQRRSLADQPKLKRWCDKAKAL